MAIPKPGTKVRSSQTGRPIMAALDLLGRRWALRILWELHLNGPSSFRSLQKLCGGISPTILNTRLSELRETGIIELKDRQGYVITEEGMELGRIIEELNEWSKRWADRLSSGEPPLPDMDKAESDRKDKKA